MTGRTALRTDALLVCTSCGACHSQESMRWRCDCGAPLDLAFTPQLPPEFEKQLQRRDWSWSRYREALPIQCEQSVSLGEACTPLVDVQIDDREFLIKQEQIASTGSFKDRGAFVLVSRARELGIQSLVEDSSGNAGAAIAAYCARADIKCRIFVPGGTSAAKTSQMKAYGAEVVEIDGDREATAEAAKEAAATEWYGSHVWNPFFYHGTKLFAYELWEQIGYRAPKVLVLPVGNGTLLLGSYLGFSELKASGYIDRMPVIVGVQALSCNPIEREYLADFGSTAFGDTIASGIAVARPARMAQIVEAVRSTGGTVLSVDEAGIAAAMQQVSALGFYVEPTGSVGLAGALLYGANNPRTGTIVTAFTGHGLKKPR